MVSWIRRRQIGLFKLREHHTMSDRLVAATENLSGTPALIALPDRSNCGNVTELSHPPGSGSEMQGIKGCRRDAPISSQRKGNSCSIFLSPRWPNPHFISTES